METEEGVIKVCEHCGKIDVSEGHEDECDPEWQAERELNMEYYD